MKSSLWVKIILYSTIASLLLALSSCSSAKIGSALLSPMCGELCWSIGGVESRARFAAAPSESSFTMSFISPPSLAGTLLTLDGGSATLTRGELTLTSIPSLYLEIASAFTSGEPLRRLGDAELGGTPAVCFGRGDCLWYLSQSGEPTALELDRALIKISLTKADRN